MDKFDKNILDEYVKFSSICMEKHPTEDLYLYGYHSNLEEPNIIWDSYNINCRGLILDSNGYIQARPFTKFFTYRKYLNNNTLLLSENQIFKIPNCSFKIFEKVDGTMVTLYWIGEKPFLATQRSFMNPNAIEATKILYEKYSHVFSKFSKDKTYIFEAVFPETNVLIDYGNIRDLYLIGIIDNKTGTSLSLEDIGFPKAKDYTNNIKQKNNFEELQNLNLPNQEGFVILFDNGERIKIKFPWYKEAHMIMNQIIIKEKQIYILNRLLAKKLNAKSKKISNINIWNLLKNQNLIQSFTKYIPEIFYSVGFEKWVIEASTELKDNYEKVKIMYPNLKDNEIWKIIKPKEIKYFNFDTMLLDPKSSTPMWKRIERLKKMFL